MNITNFVGYVWFTTADGELYVYGESRIVEIVCELDAPEYDYEDTYDYAYEMQEYDRREREWMEDENRHYEERSLFFQVSHIEPAILDGWFSG